ncbi:pantoate--beta-alanine ligase [Beggiatoa leptomitoformis]|uniref:Pantothenate synthetase n=1 Tax=Beggiatoa leptomitoformis TaxID=288004 RepID=A0A2N9YE49_9GAMM|nr:pantoate--beta-alanine ligase [Beggiatoa leptomitoformis]ALG68860.1 pantoate--beta-alanine ligase [Beggiatoa leptomitoformis]AUI68771.1 pantoate--beta-alanine ligase [Beggiatoa leptomitoformis]
MTQKTVTTIAELSSQIAQWHAAKQHVALVPTMGNLHAGHLQLVQEGLKVADHVVVSIFVNPTQFAPNEDYQSYPRTLEADCAALEKAGAELVFAPTVEEMYGQDLTTITTVEVPILSHLLCGKFRPIHFAGVTTVVNRLFNITQANIALFGQKDYQQLTIIKRMVKDLYMPIRIIGIPTVREADGLAMSSRNNYLTVAERQIAPHLFATLNQIKNRLQTGEKSFTTIEAEAVQQLQQAGFKPDYVAIRDAETLLEAQTQTKHIVILIAAWLGKARLIDNLCLSIA